MNPLKCLFLALFVVIPIAWTIKLDQQCEHDKAHATVEKEENSKKEQEAKKYPPGERDTKMRNAIKAHNTAQISRLLEGHELTLAKNKQDKAYQRFTKGLYGGWDWELCKQLAPRLAISLIWTLFVNPFYFLSTYSAFQFFKIPLNWVSYGFTAFYYFMHLIGFPAADDDAFSQRLKNSITVYWPWFTLANILYMLYRIRSDIKAPTYLMLILTNDKFTAEEKKSLQEKFHAKTTANKGRQHNPRTMETYGIICTQHKAMESIEELLKDYEDNLKSNNEENKFRGPVWAWKILFPRTVCRTLRTGLFYSGLSFTYVALPPTPDTPYKTATYKDNIPLKKDDFLLKDGEGNPKGIDFPKMMWTIANLSWAICLHNALPTEYQLPNPKKQTKQQT